MGIRSLSFSSITATGAVVTWSTDVPASTELDYGAVDASGAWAPVGLPAQGGDSTAHSVTLSGLVGGTRYRVAAKSYDGSNNFSYLPVDDGSSPAEFTTAAVVVGGGGTGGGDDDDDGHGRGHGRGHDDDHGHGRGHDGHDDRGGRGGRGEDRGGRGHG